LIVIGGVLAQAFKNKLTQAEQSNEQVKSMIDNNIKTELKDEVATNDETISSYDEWFNAKYGNWFDDKKYGEQHQKWRGKLKPLEVIMNPECSSQVL
jgi:hypothetical protein